MDDQGRAEAPAEPPRRALRRLAPRSFRGTIVAATVGLTALAMAVVVLGIQLVLEYTAQRDIEQVLEDRAQATVPSVQRASRTRLTVPQDLLEPGMVVYDVDGHRVAGSVESDVRELADSIGASDGVRTVQGPGDEEMLLAMPFTTPGGDSGVLVVSQETGPYERSERYAMLATVALALLVTGATAVIALKVTTQALKPVTQMADRAADWSEHDLTHRFGLGPPTNELAALGETLDHLLDRVASAIRSEQRLTSELAHELRTPLTAIQGSADLALLRGVEDEEVREDLRQISAAARGMAGVITTLLDAARDSTATGRACRVADVLPGLVATAADRVEVVDRTAGSSAWIGAPVDLVVRAVAPIVDNAARHARHRIVIEAVDRPDRVELVVSDDGEGVDAAVRERLFDPGVSSRRGGAGLGLGIARRLARSFGGEVELDPPAAGGASFRVRLPRR